MGAAVIPLIAGGTALDMYGQYRKGKKEEEAARFEARQLEIEAGQRKATAQARGRMIERQGVIDASRALAIAAAQGGASDPTVMNLISQIAGESHYEKMVAIYEGEEEAKQLRQQAQLTRRRGRAARRAAKLGMARSVISGATSLYTKYGMKA